MGDSMDRDGSRALEVVRGVRAQDDMHLKSGLNEPLGDLLAVLACPACRGSLDCKGLELRCRGCDRTFRIDNGVPVLSPEAEGQDDRASFVGRLRRAMVGDPRLYNLMQSRLGGRAIAAKVASELRDLDGAALLLDIGAGTGMVSRAMPPRAGYLWLDNDMLKLGGFHVRTSRCYAVIGDAVDLPIARNAVDWSTMVAVSHHLPAAALDMCLAEVARVTRDRFLFVDALRGRSMRSRVLWQLDRGRFARTEAELVAALLRYFDVVKVERFREIHDYVLCVGTPRPRRTVVSSPLAAGGPTVG